MESTEEITQILGELAQLRPGLQSLKEEKRRLEAKLLESIELTDLNFKIKVNQDIVDTYEADVRRIALFLFAETGSKKPHPATGIRVSKKYAYEDSAGIKWARLNMPVLISEEFNRSAFNAYLKGLMSENQELPGFVEIKREASATIASNLSAYKENADEQPG